MKLNELNSVLNEINLIKLDEQITDDQFTVVEQLQFDIYEAYFTPKVKKRTIYQASGTKVIK